MRRLALLTLATLAAPAAALAQELPVRGSLYHRVDGQTVHAAIELRIEPGWHIYGRELGQPDAVGKPTVVELGGEDIEWGELEFPEPEKHPQPGLGSGGRDTWIWSHHGRITLRASGSFEGEAPESITAEVDGLVCEDMGQCLPLNLALESKGEGPDRLFPAEAAPAQEPPVASAPVEEPAAPPAAEEDPLGPATGPEEIRGRLWTREKDGKLYAVIHLEVAEDWHLYDADPGSPYALPTVVELSGEGVDWGAVLFPEAEPYTDALGDRTMVHHGTVELRAVGELDGEAEDVSARVTGQVCATQCLPVDLELEPVGRGPNAAFAWIADASSAKPPADSEPRDELEDAPPAAAGPGATNAPPVEPRPAKAPKEKGDQGLLAFILAAIGGGLFALMMPCTYPMIPITISFFTKQADARGGKVLSLALAYGAGIVLIFIGIGVVVGPLIIVFATHPVTNLVIGGLFLLFALVLFGVVDLQPPRFLMNVAGKASMKGGVMGVFLMGATLVVSSFTCTAPFVGSLLAGGATGGGVGRIVIGMTAFGLTMAIPFVILSLVPGKIQAMPRSGEWMNTLKVTLGFIEVAAALKFISNADIVLQWRVLSIELFLLLWAGLFALCGMYLLGWIRLKGHTVSEISAGRFAAAMGMLLFALYCLHGMRGGRMDDVMVAILPNYNSELAGGGGAEARAGDGHGTAVSSVVVDDYERARSRAKAEGKLLLVNFTGHTCVNCRQMERGVFPEPAVAALLDRMIEARLHTDGVTEPEVTERIKALQQELTESVANPIYLVMDPVTGEVLGRQDGGSSVEEFVEFLTESSSRAQVARG